jgi:hypothetical protein
MTERRRPKLPRGLRWHSRSPYIWFSWRDAQGRQHQQSTEKTDPAEALLFKLKFLARQSQNLDEVEHETEDLSPLPLGQVAASLVLF